MSDFSFTEPMTVEELKTLNFDRLSKQEKLNVKLRGRPTPMIQLSKPSSSNGKKYIKSFKEKYLHLAKLFKFEILSILAYLKSYLKVQ